MCHFKRGFLLMGEVKLQLECQLLKTLTINRRNVTLSDPVTRNVVEIVGLFYDRWNFVATAFKAEILYYLTNDL